MVKSVILSIFLSYASVSFSSLKGDSVWLTTGSHLVERKKYKFLFWKKLCAELHDGPGHFVVRITICCQ
jgi:hypothetical protein